MSDLWLIEYEQAFEDFDAGRIDADGLRGRLKRLGFDPDEIDDHVAPVVEDEP